MSDNGALETKMQRRWKQRKMAELRDEQETILMRLVQQHQRQEPPDEPAGPSSSDATWLQYYSSWVDEDAAVSMRPRRARVSRTRIQMQPRRAVR